MSWRSRRPRWLGEATRSLVVVARSLAVVCVGLQGCAGPDAGTHDAGTHDAGTHDAALRCEGHEVARLSGAVLHAGTGAPIARARPQLCARLAPDERLVCLEPPFTDQEGAYVIEVPPNARCMRAAVLRVLVTGGTFATSYCPLEESALDAGRVPSVELFDVVQAPLPDRGDPDVPRVVPLGESLEVTLAPSVLGGEDAYRRLGAVRVAPSRSCVPAARALDGLVATSPETGLADGATFRVRAVDLAPGTRVTLFVVGGLDTRLADGSFVDEGQLASLGLGRVDADGSLMPELGVTLPQLGWLGWAVQP